MTDADLISSHGTLIEPTTLKIQRLLPGRIERVWSYLTESDLRRTWLAAGEMEPTPGSSFELVWRNNELTDPPGQRPQGFSGEHSMQSKIVEIAPPRRLVFTWGEDGKVEIDLETRGDKVLLTLIHHRLAERSTRLAVSAGWHGHLDLLVARVSGATPTPFWDTWTDLRAEYDRLLPT